MGYFSQLAMLFGLFAIWVASLRLVAGLGLTSLGLAALAGVGAYAAALSTIGWGVGTLAAVALGAMAGTGSSLVLLLALRRARGEAFAVGTVAFQGLVSALLLNERVVPGGANGLVGIPSLQSFHAGEARTLALGWITLIAIAVLLVGSRLGRGTLRMHLTLLRDSESLARSWGLPNGRLRAAIFAVAGGGAGGGGAILALQVGAIDPSSFTLMDSVEILAAAVIGGLHRSLGPIWGAGLFVVAGQLPRWAGIGVAEAGQLRAVAFGLLLALLAARGGSRLQQAGSSPKDG